MLGWTFWGRNGNGVLCTVVTGLVARETLVFHKVCATNLGGQFGRARTTVNKHSTGCPKNDLLNKVIEGNKREVVK